MAEASLSCTAAFQRGPDEAPAEASAAVINLHRHGRDQAEPYIDDDSRGDARLLILLCAASAAMTLSALYFIVSELSVF